MNDTFCTMRHLGAVFGVSSRFIGRALKEMGLRTPDGQLAPKGSAIHRMI
jgi:hypothetical protein